MPSFKFALRSQLVLWLLVLLPILIQLPALSGNWNPDPSLFVGSFGDSVTVSGGYPWIDPNTGFQAQALGKLSADQWLHGHIPWWNAYNGVGLPLAAEAQPGSLFLPFVLLYHFRDGGLWVEVLLQIIAGLCTYALCRKLKLTRLAAFAGGMLFELNGTFAWHGAPIIAPVAFLPMLLLGVEHLREQISTRQVGGWLLIPFALAWSLYAGFPETAYISGLLAGLWVLARLAGLDQRQKRDFLGKLVFAVSIGLLCSLPLLVPFVEYLQLAYVGGHDGAFAHVSLPAVSSLVSVMPWLFGPIDRFNDQSAAIGATWDSIGGYLTALSLAMAVLGIMLAPRRLSLTLFAWMLLCLAKAYDWRPLSDMVNVLPMVKSAAFSRYSPPSWELCGALLAAFAINGLQRQVALSPWRQLCVFIIGLLFAGTGLWLQRDCIGALLTAKGYANYFYYSIGWLLFSLLAASLLIAMRRQWRMHARLLVLLLLADAGLAFSLPIYSGARHVHWDESGIAFLKSHSGLQRTYSLGPLAPNYGGYFQIAQINHNYLPITQSWLDYIHRHLDPAANPITFIGEGVRADHETTVETEMRLRHKAYEELAVKYVLAPHGSNPFVDTVSTAVSESTNKPLLIKANANVVLQWRLPTTVAASKVTGLAVKIGNYGGHADGVLTAQVCIEDGSCARGESSLIGSVDNGALAVVLDQSVNLPSQNEAKLTITLGYEHSDSAVVIWDWPIVGKSAKQLIMKDPIPGFAPAVTLQLAPQGLDTAGVLVYSKPDMDIYELPGAKPYFEVLGGPCALKSESRVLAILDCKGSAQLLRREAFYLGWQASIDGVRVPLERTREIFQQVNLKAGRQRVSFDYAPTHLGLIKLGLGLGVIGLLYGVCIALPKRTGITPEREAT
jgi:hypothetical protein